MECSKNKKIAMQDKNQYIIKLYIHAATLYKIKPKE